MAVQGVVIVRKRNGLFYGSLFGWRSDLLHVESAMCYELLQQKNKITQIRSNFGLGGRNRYTFVPGCVQIVTR